MMSRLAQTEIPSVWWCCIQWLFSCSVWEWMIWREMTNRLAWIDFHSIWWLCIPIQRAWCIKWIDNAKWWWWNEVMNRLAQTHFTHYRRRRQWILPLSSSHHSRKCFFNTLLPSRHAFSRNSHSPSRFWRQEWCENHWMSHFNGSLIRSYWLPWRVRLPSWILSQPHTTQIVLHCVLHFFLQTNPLGLAW